MILVDIFVPAVDQTYNFSLNEDIEVGAIIEEISEMIAQKEQTELHGEAANLNLFNIKEHRILPRQNSLSDCFITTGTSLMLI